MKATLELVDAAMRFEGRNERGQSTSFDADPAVGGRDSAARPMEVLLQAVMACTAMDVLSIVRKKRRTVIAFRIVAEAERAAEHPKVFTRIHLRYELTSPDAAEQDLYRAIELSQGTYCSASIMVRRSGCSITWEAHVLRPEGPGVVVG
ncbi:MAG: OsmC family protein [Candidatus Kapabacteria bacterium]|nr:OsmC family protein [Candidatus Kapabacteria bacterium]MCS7170534.1 OsmC family protein [Candidatus Kapabacteria bacterium]MDW7996477.1 OsmC family protein [Bacteroidota bacterium]MDW8225904.1 OsmC family protein [Bacteroidota bacterium]